MASPLLLYNICMELPLSSFLVLSSVPWGTPRPAVPTARSLTVARVGSPFSNDHKYQSLYLHAIRTYFGAGLRLIKKGDLIAVPIDTDVVHHYSYADMEDGTFNGAGSSLFYRGQVSLYLLLLLLFLIVWICLRPLPIVTSLPVAMRMRLSSL